MSGPDSPGLPLETRMCLGIPGEVQSITDGELRTGRVAFGPVVKEVCLAYVPEAEIGDFVIVHAGFAISRVDREAAARVFSYLEEMGATAEAVAPTEGGATVEVAASKPRRSP